jgi:hypothetical protein
MKKVSHGSFRTVARWVERDGAHRVDHGLQLGNEWNSRGWLRRWYSQQRGL